MNALVDGILAILEQHALVKSTRVVHYDETPSGKLEIKIRSQLPGSYQLQIWIHAGSEAPDYAYQLFAAIPLLRWDNSPHYGHLLSAPHHFHDEQGRVLDSPLTGNVKRDLKIILREISDWLENREQ